MNKRKYIVVFCLLALPGCRQGSTPKTADNIVGQVILSTEKSKMDSLQKLKEKEQQEVLTEFNSRPLITQDEAEVIGPVIHRWVNFHKIDITQARSSGEHTVYFDWADDPETSIYYREFTSEEDSPNRIEMDYSPNKQRYVDLGVRYKTVDGSFYINYDAYDDNQEVYITDRGTKRNHMIVWFGASGRAEDVFWQNNDVLILVGRQNNKPYTYFITVFDFSRQTRKYYEILMNENTDPLRYDLNLNGKGISTEYKE